MKGKNLMIILLALVVLAGGGYYGFKQMFGVQEVIVDATEQGQKIAEYANPDAFITPVQLKDLMDSGKDVVVIGSLNPKTGDAPIEGSFTMWRDDYSAKEGAYEYEGMRNTIEETEAILSSYGATPKSTIVVYASNAHHDAARLWWQIKLLGHKNVRYLDGGLNAWVGAGYSTGGDAPVVEATNYKAPKASEALIANFEDVVAALNTETVLLDTRAMDEEDGSSTKKGAFGPGKIPGAVWIEWTQSVNEDTTLKSLDELKEIYGAFEGKEIIPYCQSGVRSAHTLLVLTQALGYENVKNYDGSWIEWSYEHYEKNNAEALVENGK
ncbi:sulfurtransferase [Alkaliphilus hydrothermalis]|uniref:Sulfurtransferase n=1 Tax=Alkaliphilus hydrothermalis TaxID=1482730 RepID=A0ABS2NQG1_9FIRM|nr:rhodanese-like domain-containing protein [Alkaliphilus hydrothermalis]MBM7615175.1 thiosulfate/3-mercaptopyruvate sulfurtransferase [Alkaliphilus hydrothermalis]